MDGFHKNAIVLIISLIFLSGCKNQNPPSNWKLSISPVSTPQLNMSKFSTAQSEFWTEDWVEVEKIAGELHRSNPSSIEVILFLAPAQVGLGDFSAAVQNIEEIKPAKITNKELLLRILETDIGMAKKTIDLQLTKKILNHARTVISQLNKIDPNIISESDSALIMTSRPDYANDISEVSPEAIIYFREGELNFKSQNYMEAQKNYEQALQKDPDFPLAALYLADTYYSIGDYETAVNKLESLLGKFPNLIQGWEFLGDAYQKMGLWKHAWRAYASGLMLDSGNIGIQVQMAKLNLKYVFWKGGYLNKFEIPVRLPIGFSAAEIPLNDSTIVSLDEGSVSIQSQEPTSNFRFAWQQIPYNLPYSDERKLPSELLLSISSESPKIKPRGDPLRYLYSPENIYYQDILFQDAENKVTNFGTHLSWICGKRLFFVQILVPEENKNQVDYVRNVLFENFSCR